MENNYKLIERLARQAGGHYRFSTILIKRVRQVVKGFSSIRHEPADPIGAAFAEYIKGRLQITGEAKDLLAEEKPAKKTST